MAKKDNKTKIQKPEAHCRRMRLKLRRPVGLSPSIRPILLRRKRCALRGRRKHDIRAQHELFADIEERDSDIAANMGTRKRALLTLNWRVAPMREMRRPKKKSCPTKPTK